jgi:hypothetical protein
LSALSAATAYLRNMRTSSTVAATSPHCAGGGSASVLPILTLAPPSEHSDTTSVMPMIVATSPIIPSPPPRVPTETSGSHSSRSSFAPDSPVSSPGEIVPFDAAFGRTTTTTHATTPLGGFPPACTDGSPTPQATAVGNTPVSRAAMPTRPNTTTSAGTPASSFALEIEADSPNGSITDAITANYATAEQAHDAEVGSMLAMQAAELRARLDAQVKSMLGN